jgi:hypothetical protein
MGGDEGETATRTTLDSSFEQPMIATLIKHNKPPKRVSRFMLPPLNKVEEKKLRSTQTESTHLIGFISP